MTDAVFVLKGFKLSLPQGFQPLEWEGSLLLLWREPAGLGSAGPWSVLCESFRGICTSSLWAQLSWGGRGAAASLGTGFARSKVLLVGLGLAKDIRAPGLSCVQQDLDQCGTG